MARSAAASRAPIGPPCRKKEVLFSRQFKTHCLVFESLFGPEKWQMSESSAQLQAALALTEKVPQRHFAQFLRRCAIALRNRNESPYSEDEVQILLEQFEMSPTDLDSMFSCCFYILQQAACFSFDSSKIQAYVTQCGASESVSSCFGAVWDAEGDELVEALKQRSLSDKTLDRTAWRLEMKASDKKGPSRDPLMLLDLSVSGERPVTIQFDHQSLSKLYSEIEQIQQQIDKLT